MKKLLFLSVCLWAHGFLPARAQTGAPDVVLVKAEMRAGFILTVTRGGKTVVVSEIGYSQLEKQRSLPEEASQTLYTQLFQDGYALKGTYGASSPSVGGSTNWLIFSKER